MHEGAIDSALPHLLEVIKTSSSKKQNNPSSSLPQYLICNEEDEPQSDHLDLGYWSYIQTASVRGVYA